MSDYIDTRDGWREVDGLKSPPPTGCLIEHDDRGLVARIWVREAPVPPLPTEPYTVIRVQWHNRSRGDGSYVLHPEPYGGVWVSTAHDAADWVRADQIQEYITGFDVLAEPPAVTAKAVLDRVCQKLPLGFDETSLEYLKEISREFRAIIVEKDIK